MNTRTDVTVADIDLHEVVKSLHIQDEQKEVACLLVKNYIAVDLIGEEIQELFEFREDEQVAIDYALLRVADIMIDILMENLGNETIRDDLEVSERFFKC